jgi:hypothetical protein
MNVNPDTMNFLYVCRISIPSNSNIDTNGFWMFNFMSQIVLPEEIKFIIITITLFQRKLFYFIAVKPIRMLLDLSLSKKVLRG